ncbi:uncharacterized protein LOC119740848 [Patiria miniata]|uniref:Cyclin-dependent kinase inhibitor domain-containing protein n=1 Tax=Patiria miniata TaxID=46514 RepID=A0A914B7S4_PATMI|nr:uncharacterized protein LOC119740848 [Patiria miniata]
MSSARVESPLLLQEFRRQPSPPIVSRMPKPRACRKLFVVDHDETNRFLQDELVKMEGERGERKEYGFDFDRGEPLPDRNSSSRYTDWEAVPNERVPSFYHETVARRKPCRPSSRPTPAFFTSSSHHRSSNNGHSNPAPPCSTGRNAAPAAPSGLLTGASSRSFLSVKGLDLQPANQRSTAGTSPHHPKEIPPILEVVNGSESKPRDNFESAEGSTCVANNARTSATQSQITDFMRQRKRTGSDSSSSTSSVSSSDSDGEKHPQVPAKRRRQRPGSPVVSSPTTGRS